MLSDRLTRADAIRIYEKVMHDVLGIPDASHLLRVALDRDGVTSLITLLFYLLVTWKRMMTTVSPITMGRHRPKRLRNGVY